MEPNEPNQNNPSSNLESTTDPSQLSPTLPAQSTLQQTATPEYPPSLPDKNGNSSNNKIALAIALVVVVLAIAAIGIYAMKQNSNSTNQQLSIHPTQSATSPTTIPFNTPTTTNSNTASPETECGEFPDMLETCAKYSCYFTHPLTGEEMSRKIVGIVNDKCSYAEEMPNNGKMECNYTEEMRIAVAQYHRDLVDTQSFGTEISVELNPEETEVNTIYTINGKNVDNPLQEALTTGQCVVSGY